MQALSETQTKFIYYLDVVGVSVSRACELSGVNQYEATKMLEDPEIAHVRRVQKDQARAKTGFTREDVTFGIHDAIEQARLLADPMAQIRGWTEIARINGLDAAKKVEVEITVNSPNAPAEQLKQLTTAQLAALVDQGDVIDGDFYRVEADRE